MRWKPDAYPDVSPYLLVKDAERTLQFLEAAFGAHRLRIIPRDDGQGLMHAEARIGDSVVMMGETPDAVPAHIHVYVPDADAAFAKAIAAGGLVVQPLTESGDGDRRGGILDESGTTWWISTQSGG
ncbi:MAG: hypothetical protein DI498_02570 [Paracoccus denitrificans]|nr:MAG: hypothetical protein DI498_02570 [Paracoccus denitrificans]PZO86025.1 MAG: hypothetical protein DI633_02570 [Paracoccus denitrificans]